MSLRWRVLVALARTLDMAIEFFYGCHSLLRVHVTRRWARRNSYSLADFERDLDGAA